MVLYQKPASYKNIRLVVESILLAITFYAFFSKDQITQPQTDDEKLTHNLKNLEHRIEVLQTQNQNLKQTLQNLADEKAKQDEQNSFCHPIRDISHLKQA